MRSNGCLLLGLNSVYFFFVIQVFTELIFCYHDISGKWYKKKFIAKISEKHGPVTSNQAIAIAGNNCYSTTKRIFKKAGYDKVLLAVGDHEIGE